MTTTPDLAVKAAVAQAFESITKAFPDAGITSHPDGQGGLWVEVTGVPLEGSYTQTDTFVIFLLPFTLPDADVYPMFLRPDLSRRDGRPLSPGLSAGQQLSWPGVETPRPVVMVSRRTTGAFIAQSAAQKLSKVLHWVVTQ